MNLIEIGICPVCLVEQPWRHGFCEDTAGCNTALRGPLCRKHRVAECAKCEATVTVVDYQPVAPPFPAPAVPTTTTITTSITFEPTTLPTDSKARKDIPMARGALDYFPAAWAAVAELSRIGNDKHNPGEDLHWARGKSMDHADCILRHLAERGTLDDDGLSHTVKVAWRALALLQEELEAAGAPRARGAR